MDAQVVQLLTEAINKVDNKVDKIDEKVSEVLQFKWQIIGGSAGIAFIVGCMIQIFIALMSK